MNKYESALHWYYTHARRFTIFLKNELKNFIFIFGWNFVSERPKTLKQWATRRTHHGWHLHMNIYRFNWPGPCPLKLRKWLLDVDVSWSYRPHRSVDRQRSSRLAVTLTGLLLSGTFFTFRRRPVPSVESWWNSTLRTWPIFFQIWLAW